MQVELYNEISTMIKYKADKEHFHPWTWIAIICLLLAAIDIDQDKKELEARVAYLEQRVGVENTR